MGTLIQKIQFQATPSTMAPPTSGPMAMARPPTAPQRAEGHAATLSRHRGRQQRQRQRRHDRGADALGHAAR